MLGLRLGISFGHQRAPQPIARIQQVKQALALADPHRHAIALAQAKRKARAIPEIGLQASGCRGLAHQAAHFLQLFGGQSGWTAGMVAFGQTGHAVPVKASNPIDERTRRIAKHSRHLLATQARRDQKHAMKAVIIASVLMAVNFLLQHSAAVLR